MPLIEDIELRKIINSRGEPTIEVEVKSKEEIGVFSSPSGASVGRHEAISFPKNDVEISLKRLRQKKDKLIGLDIFDQKKIDKKLREIDGTQNFSHLGGNAAIAISIATAKVASKQNNLELFEHLSQELIDYTPSLPLPLGNIIEGGEHAGEGSTEIQEFLVLPTKVNNIHEAVFANAEVHRKVKELLRKRNKDFSGGKGDEGGWVEALNTEEAIEVLKKAIKEVEKNTEIKIDIGLDVAASEMWKNKKYHYRRAKNKTQEQQIEFLQDLCKKYDIKYLEDPLHEDDFDGFRQIKQRINDDKLICGDDLFVTNKKRIKKGIKNDSANTVLIKPNQIGTLTDTIEAINLAKENNYTTVVSHRSGETTDNSIAHLAVSTSEVIKCGAVNGERIAKLNELIRVEEKTNIEIANLRC